MPEIYIARNVVDGTCYIGKTLTTAQKRWHGHCRAATHKNLQTHFARAIRKYGIDSFSIDTLEICERDVLSQREKFWIALAQSVDAPMYNMTLGGDGIPGFQHRLESRAKMSEAHKNKRLSSEHRENISKSTRGMKRSSQTCTRISNAQKGKPKPSLRCREFTKEHRKKLAIAHIGMKHNDDTRAKLRAKWQERRELRELFVIDPEQFETYVSVDIEATGPIPGPYSMVSIGCVAYDASLRCVGTFFSNIEELPFASVHPETQKFWENNKDAWLATRCDPKTPDHAMIELLKWVNSLTGKPVFVAYPAAFDWMFVAWYLHMFGEKTNPFSFSALDMKTYAMAMLRTPFRATVKKAFPEKWKNVSKHTHVALDDAREQGDLFLEMLKANGVKQFRHMKLEKRK